MEIIEHFGLEIRVTELRYKKFTTMNHPNKSLSGHPECHRSPRFHNRPHNYITTSHDLKTAYCL